MKTNVKKSTAILCLGLILGTSVVTGCSLVTTNYDKYYNAVAARIDFKDGSKIEITRKDLRIAYSTYQFNQYVENYGFTQEEAYTKALDYLVSKELAIRDAEIKSKELNADDAILTSKEKTYLWEKTYESMKDSIMGEVKKIFRPEFINRVDEIIVFHSLEQVHIDRIAMLMMQNVAGRLQDRGVTLEITPEAAAVVAQAGYDLQYGARPLRRCIEDEVESVLSEAIISEQFVKGDIPIVDLEKGKIVLKKS